MKPHSLGIVLLTSGHSHQTGGSGLSLRVRQVRFVHTRPKMLYIALVYVHVHVHCAFYVRTCTLCSLLYMYFLDFTHFVCNAHHIHILCFLGSSLILELRESNHLEHHKLTEISLCTGTCTCTYTIMYTCMHVYVYTCIYIVIPDVLYLYSRTTIDYEILCKSYISDI